MSCVRPVSKVTGFEQDGQGSNIPRDLEISPFRTKESLKSYHRKKNTFNSIAVGDHLLRGSAFESCLVERLF
jgi:hypothetical protein